MVMSERETFHVLTRSVMKEFLHDVKCMVLDDKQKNHILCKIRVYVWHRSDNLPEDRAKRAGLGDSHRDRLTYTYGLCKYVWSHVRTTDQQYHQWLRARRARRQLLKRAVQFSQK